MRVAAMEIRQETLEERKIGHGLFAREIGLCANDQMRCAKVSEGRHDLGGVESGIQRDLCERRSVPFVGRWTIMFDAGRTYQDGAQFEESICELPVTSVGQLSDARGWTMLTYRGILNVIPQADGHSITLADAVPGQSSREGIALDIE